MRLPHAAASPHRCGALSGKISVAWAETINCELLLQRDVAFSPPISPNGRRAFNEVFQQPRFHRVYGALIGGVTALRLPPLAPLSRRESRHCTNILKGRESRFAWVCVVIMMVLKNDWKKRRRRSSGASLCRTRRSHIPPFGGFVIIEWYSYFYIVSCDLYCVSLYIYVLYIYIKIHHFMCFLTIILQTTKNDIFHFLFDLFYSNKLLLKTLLVTKNIFWDVLGVISWNHRSPYDKFKSNICSGVAEFLFISLGDIKEPCFHFPWSPASASEVLVQLWPHKLCQSVIEWLWQRALWDGQQRHLRVNQSLRRWAGPSSAPEGRSYRRVARWTASITAVTQ